MSKHPKDPSDRQVIERKATAYLRHFVLIGRDVVSAVQDAAADLGPLVMEPSSRYVLSSANGIGFEK